MSLFGDLIKETTDKPDPDAFTKKELKILKSGGAETKKKKKQKKRRTYKFRAWLKDQEEMKVIKKIDFAKFEKDKLFKNMKLMQFTGIHDVKGVEVYDGDVIVDSSRPDNQRLYRVLFQDGAYILTSWPDKYEPPMNFKGYFDEYFQPNLSPLETKRRIRLEIIGHIYEPIEILESRMLEIFKVFE